MIKASMPCDGETLCASLPVTLSSNLLRAWTASHIEADLDAVMIVEDDMSAAGWSTAAAEHVGLQPLHRGTL